MFGLKPVEELPRRMLCWIDGVGGYLLCLSTQVRLGQATPDAEVEIPIYADISRLHAVLTRDSEGYLLEALKPVAVNQKVVDKALLKDGDQLRLGTSCQLIFHQPVPITATASLELTAGHRLPLSVNGVVLMADTCIFGAAGCHIVVPDLQRSVVLYRRKDGLGVRMNGEFSVDGANCKDKATVHANSTIAGEDFRLTLEPLGSRVGKVRV